MKKIIIHFIFITVSIILIYSNVIDGDFLFDDEHFILRNIYITDWKYIKNIFLKNVTAGAGLTDNFWRPLSTVIWLFLNKTFGLDKRIFHITNILFHILTSIILYLLLLKLYNNNKISLLGSLFFAVHPVNTEAVSYISGLGDPLSLCFVLFCIYFYISFKEKPNIFKSIIFLLSNIVAILAKERAVIIPSLILLFELYFSFKQRNYFISKRPYYSYLLFFITSLISLVWLILRLTILNFQNTFNFYKIPNIYSQNLYVRIYTFLSNFLEYLKLLIIPYPLYMERQVTIFTSFTSTRVILGFIILVGIFIICIKSIKKYPELFLSYTWFLLCLLPTSGIIPINAIFMEHWLFFSMIGCSIFISFLLIKHNWTKYLLIPILIIFSFLTYKQNFVWKDSYSFFQHILKYNPNSVAANNNFAMAAAEMGEIDKAILHYKKAISLDNTFPQPRHNLARIYVSLSQFEKAIQEYKEALKIDPDFIYTHIDLLKLYTYLNQPKMAEFHKKEIERITKKVYE
ncbi:MAG: tetratricopeptide repeat protein [Endomicrobia bacterium]|nr:tetratricopeptide repeat protein [Endomicrobiia bacterium]MDW8055391.1 tetratricopeptide repeat protein [Elusimicrobiota bacterium]